MSIFNSDSLAPPKNFPRLRSLLKQGIMAVLVGGLILIFYLAICKDRDTDRSIGKYAYISSSGDFLGVIKWHGRSIKTGNNIYQIKKITGDIIEISDLYVVVRDQPPREDKF